MLMQKKNVDTRVHGLRWHSHTSYENLEISKPTQIPY